MLGMTLFGLLFTPSFYVMSCEFGTWARSDSRRTAQPLTYPTGGYHNSISLKGADRIGQW